MGLPGYRSGIVGLRAPTAPLIVEDQLELVREIEKVRQEVRVVGAGSTVQDEHLRGTEPSVPTPVQRKGRRVGETRLAWFGNPPWSQFGLTVLDSSLNCRLLGSAPDSDYPPRRPSATLREMRSFVGPGSSTTVISSPGLKAPIASV